MVSSKKETEMKKNFLYSMILMLATMFVTSCENDSTEGLTFITYYPTLTLEGESFVTSPKGSAFQDPGYSATLQGEDVTSQVEVKSNIDTNKSGLYTISYSITNEDGFAKTASRQVLVVDPNDPIENLYTTSADSYRNSGGKITVYGASYKLYILSNGDGTYTINDMLGGYYDKRAGYGSAYAMVGTFTVAEDGTITALSGNVAGWGDSMDYLEEGKYDAATGTISWKVGYAGMDFYVTMNK
jgi:hypothetical protein